MRTLINDRNRDRELGTWIAEKVDVDFEDGNVCFGTEEDGKLIGAVMFNQSNGSNVCAHQRLDSKYALSRPLLRTAFQYAFWFLKARRITAAAYIENQAAIRLDRKLGFVVEAVVKDFFPRGGTIVQMVMWPENCRFLEV